MIKDFLNNLKADFSNIDEVYNLLLKKYNPDNVNTTAVTFIDSIDFDNVQQSNNVSKLSLYLGKQRNKVQWQLLDYYNHYITTKRFGFFNLGERKKNEFDDFSNNLIEYKTQYDYIFNKLTDIKKIEFANDYLDKLKKLNDFQKLSKYKTIIENMILEIENDFKNYNSNSEPQQIESSKPDEVNKETHNQIFKGNAFDVWQSMFKKFDIDKSKRTDIDFMFEVMKYNKQIHPNIRFTDIQNWINEEYEIAFDKIKYTNHKATSNEKRLIIYNGIISK